MKVVSISFLEESPERYDLEVARLHNFVASGVVVHNCNGRWCYKDGRLWCGSHHQIKKPAKSSFWWRVAEQYRLLDKLSQAPGVVFYGEVYGWVQDLRYGAKPGELYLAFFDAYAPLHGGYLDYDYFSTLCKDLGLPTVPLLYDGPWDGRLVDYAEGPTATAADNVREGFVVRPAQERFDDRIGRVVLKYIGEGYLTRKKAT